MPGVWPAWALQIGTLLKSVFVQVRTHCAHSGFFFFLGEKGKKKVNGGCIQEAFETVS